jgi:hypothetical protein
MTVAFPGRTDADGRRYGPLESLDDVRALIVRHRQEQGDKLESAEAEGTALAAKIFTREG